MVEGHKINLTDFFSMQPVFCFCLCFKWDSVWLESELSSKDCSPRLRSWTLVLTAAAGAVVETVDAVGSGAPLEATAHREESLSLPLGLSGSLPLGPP